MASQEAVLKILETHRGEAVSGETIAKSLGLSRSAVWKAVQALRQKGYHITSKTNGGYTLSEDNHLLSVAALTPWLKDPLQAKKLHIYQTVDSTNTRARELASAGAPGLTAVLSETQTKGRGRMGRTFFSPAGTGLYLSLILRPSYGLEQSLFVTVAACTVVRQAIEAVTGLVTDIKWVNDLYYKGRKICGILTEAASDFESGSIDYIIVGIGINLLPPETGFPEDLSDKAGALLDAGGLSALRIRLAAEIINRAGCLSDLTDTAALMADYRSHSLVLGRQVHLTMGSRHLDGYVRAITDQGCLELETADGTLHTISSGEVSLRLK